MNNNMKTQKSDSALTMNKVTAAEWQKLLPGVKAVIKKVWEKAGRRDSYMLAPEDLETEAFLVYSKCKKAYTAEKGAAFKTYFMHALEHELADKLRCGNMAMLSGARETFKRMGRAAAAHMNEELSLTMLKEMYPGEKELTLKNDLALWKGKRLSLDAAYGDEGDMRNGYGVVEDTDCVSPRVAAFQRDWNVLMKALTPAERLILQALQGYGNEGEACRRLGISRPTFRLRKKELLARLRRDEDWRLMRECVA